MIMESISPHLPCCGSRWVAPDRGARSLRALASASAEQLSCPGDFLKPTTGSCRRTGVGSPSTSGAISFTKLEFRGPRLHQGQPRTHADHTADARDYW